MFYMSRKIFTPKIWSVIYSKDGQSSCQKSVRHSIVLINVTGVFVPVHAAEALNDKGFIESFMGYIRCKPFKTKVSSCSVVHNQKYLYDGSWSEDNLQTLQL